MVFQPRHLDSILLLIFLISYCCSSSSFSMNIAEKVTRTLEFHQKGQIDEALEGYLDLIPRLEAASQSTILAKMHSNTGAVFMQKGLYSEARHHFESAVDINPSDVSVLMNLSIVLTTKLGEHRKALKYALKALQLDPKSSKLYHLLGNIFQSMGREEDAEKYYIKAEELALEAADRALKEGDDGPTSRSSLLPHFVDVKIGDEIEASVSGVRHSMVCISTIPLIFTASQLLTPEECQHIVSRASGSLESSFVMGGGHMGSTEEGKEEASSSLSSSSVKPHRKSENTWLPSDDTLRSLQSKISALIKVSPSYMQSRSEELQVVRYSSGGYFNLHHDSSAFHPRLVTALLYLNELPAGSGGETWFPLGDSALDPHVPSKSVEELIAEYNTQDPYSRGIWVRPKAGDAIIFFNHNISSRSLDPCAIHAGLPVLGEGEKWIANYWLGFDASDTLM